MNTRDGDGNTLLMWAAVYGTGADLDFLPAHGADVNAGTSGHTALMGAIPDLARPMARGTSIRGHSASSLTSRAVFRTVMTSGSRCRQPRGQRWR